MTPIPYDAVARTFNATPRGKLFCLHGTSAVFRLSLYVAAQGLVRDVPVALVDGTNRFDVYYLAEFARRYAVHAREPAVSPERLLDRIYVARAFTCYQMEATLTERLPAFLERNGVWIALIFGPLDTYYDDQAPLREVRESLARVHAALAALKERGVDVLVAAQDVRPAAPERQTLFPAMARIMDRVYCIGEQHGKPTIAPSHTSREIRTDGTHRTDIHHGHPAGNGKLGKIPAGPPAGRSGGAR